MPNVNTHMQYARRNPFNRYRTTAKRESIEKTDKTKLLLNTMHLVRLKYNFPEYCYGGLKQPRGNNPLNFHVDPGQSCLGRVIYSGVQVIASLCEHALGYVLVTGVYMKTAQNVVLRLCLSIASKQTSALLQTLPFDWLRQRN